MIGWSDSDEAVRQAVREFIDKEVRPNLDELESGQLPPYDIIRSLFAAFGLDTLAADAVSGLIARERDGAATQLPGSGSENGNLPAGGISMAAVLFSELAGVSLGLVASLGVSLGLCAATIAQQGTLAQKERWLPKLATFEHVGAWAITEPDAGSDAFGGMSTYVTRDGESYILNGRKTFITNSPYADVIVVYAKLDEGDGADKRDRTMLTFVLDGGMDGLAQPRPFKKMGLMSSPTGELTFDSVRLGPDRLLASKHAASATAAAGSDSRDNVRGSFAAERMGVAVLALGIINEAQRLSISYAKQRTLRGRPISDLQLIQLKLAKMEVARINVQNMVFSMLEHLASTSLPSLAEASAMKLYASEAAYDVAGEAIQLFGGNGYMTEYRVEQLARDAKSLMIYAGSNEIQVTHVAKGVLSRR